MGVPGLAPLCGPNQEHAGKLEVLLLEGVPPQIQISPHAWGSQEGWEEGWEGDTQPGGLGQPLNPDL